MLHATPLIVLLSALSVTSSPIGSLGEGASKGLKDLKTSLFSLDFALHLNLTLGGNKIADLDRARASAKLAASSVGGEFRRDGTISTTNTGVTYVVDIGVGEPATTYSLVVDTGSSNTWIGANQSYVPTSSSTNLGKNVSLSYGSGKMAGVECKFN